MERLLMVVGLLSMLADRCKDMIPQVPDEKRDEIKIFLNLRKVLDFL